MQRYITCIMMNTDQRSKVLFSIPAIDKKVYINALGKIGIVLDSSYYYAASESDADEEAKQRSLQFQLGYYAHPIFHPDGNYPQIMIDRVAQRSKLEGFSHSRMPTFTSEEVNFIRGTADYFGLNHYTSYYASYVDDYEVSDPNFYLDQGTITEYVESSIHGNNDWPVSNLRIIFH